jgi:exosome complex component RRP42
LTQFQPIYYLDATSAEEIATPLKLVLVFSFLKGEATLHAMRLFGAGELPLGALKELIQVRLA